MDVGPSAVGVTDLKHGSALEKTNKKRLGNENYRDFG